MQNRDNPAQFLKGVRGELARLFELVSDCLKPGDRGRKVRAEKIVELLIAHRSQSSEGWPVFAFVLAFPFTQDLRRVEAFAILPVVDGGMVGEADEDEVGERVSLLPFFVSGAWEIARGVRFDGVDVGDLGVLLEDARPYLVDDGEGTSGSVTMAVAKCPERGLNSGGNLASRLRSHATTIRRMIGFTKVI